MESAAVPIVELVGVSKHYQGVKAVEEVSLQLRQGEVLCLLGENGAGKSTLIKMLTGVTHPTRGQVLLDGRVVRLRSPRDARNMGIATVFQDVGTLPLMDIGRNFVLGAEPTRGRGVFQRLDIRAARELAAMELRRFGIQRAGDSRRLVGTMSGGERQALAIARAVHFGARVLVLDEPTAAMGVRESSIILSVIAQARDSGVAVLLVTHNALQAHAIGDRFVVISRGRVQREFGRGVMGSNELLEVMGDSENATSEVS